LIKYELFHERALSLSAWNQAKVLTAVKYRKVYLIREVEERIKETLKGIFARYEMAIDGIDF